MPSLIASWFPANLVIEAGRRVMRIPEELVTRAFAVHSPLNYPAVLPKQRLMVIGGLGDRLAPPDQAVRLWEHWERPELHWYPGSHILHLSRGRYLDAMRALMDGT
jgi:pimeloyl-ACP methyl ester carboxylesterase